MIDRWQTEHPGAQQPSLSGLCPVADGLATLSRAGPESRGAVFTRREVVEFILDLVGYTSDRPLWNCSLLEPSCGDGDFVVPAIERLLAAWAQQEHPVPARHLARCIRAVELHQVTYKRTRAKISRTLRASGINGADAAALSECWLMKGDFLLTDFSSTYEFVVGNPPYVRHELIPDALICEYRTRYETVFDRADLYVPFIERSVKLLSPEGKLGIICADRWIKNRYGGPLRRLLSQQFQLHIYIDMVGTPAFQSDVTAYPGIFIIGREKTGTTRVARRPEINSRSLTELACKILQPKLPAGPVGPVHEISRITTGTQPWILNPSEEFTLVRRLERDFLTLEDAGCKVGIGVATGADKAFIGPYDHMDVEDDRKLPLVTTQDIKSGNVQWRGLGVVNPFADSGGLVPLSEYPRLSRYFDERKADLIARYIARKDPHNWYRTIDRINPPLATTPKLLIPDIKGEPHVVHEAGYLYPHHNLYYITSSEWELEALQVILLSGIARLFVSAYSTRMRGGYLRFQAQHLRRIRVPRRSSVPNTTSSLLIEAAASGDPNAYHGAVAELYQLTWMERALLASGSNPQPPGHA